MLLPIGFQQLFISCKYKYFISYTGLKTQLNYVESFIITIMCFVNNLFGWSFALLFVNNCGYLHRFLNELSTYFFNFVEKY